MRTRDKIKSKAIELFNQKGFKNVTLREVAKALGKSYGNITYYFKTKRELILELYEDMINETNEILATLSFQNIFHSILEAPKKTFQISIKYLFFYVDFVEIKRSYESIHHKVEESIKLRKQNYIKVLEKLQDQNILRQELTKEDLDYLMDLSGAMRTFFFINLHPDSLNKPTLEDEYISYVNRLVIPYLTSQGIEAYKAHLS